MTITQPLQAAQPNQPKPHISSKSNNFQVRPWFDMTLLWCNLSLEAQSVAAYLGMKAVQQTNGSFEASPSLAEIAKMCFLGSYPNAGEGSLRRKAAEAIHELEACNVLLVYRQQGLKINNRYCFQPRDCWRRRPEDFLERWKEAKGTDRHPNIHKGRSQTTKPQDKSSGVCRNKGPASTLPVQEVLQGNHDDRPVIVANPPESVDDRPVIVDDHQRPFTDDRPVIIGENAPLSDHRAIIGDHRGITYKELIPLEVTDLTTFKGDLPPVVPPRGGNNHTGEAPGEIAHQSQSLTAEKLVELEGLSTTDVVQHMRHPDRWAKCWEWYRQFRQKGGVKIGTKKRAAIAWLEFEAAYDLSDEQVLADFRDRCATTTAEIRKQPGLGKRFDEWLLGRPSGGGIAQLSGNDWVEWIAPLHNVLAPDAWARVDIKLTGWTRDRQRSLGEMFVRCGCDRDVFRQYLTDAYAGAKLDEFYSGRKVLDSGRPYAGSMETLFRQNRAQLFVERVATLAATMTADDSFAEQVHSGHVQPATDDAEMEDFLAWASQRPGQTSLEEEQSHD